MYIYIYIYIYTHTLTQQSPQVPTNGLVIYCGTILTDENKERKVNIDFEPFKPINTSLYLCDNKFHTEALQVHGTPRNTAAQIHRRFIYKAHASTHGGS